MMLMVWSTKTCIINGWKWGHFAMNSFFVGSYLIIRVLLFFFLSLVQLQLMQSDFFHRYIGLCDFAICQRWDCSVIDQKISFPSKCYTFGIWRFSSRMKSEIIHYMDERWKTNEFLLMKWIKSKSSWGKWFMNVKSITNDAPLASANLYKFQLFQFYAETEN